MTVPALHLAGAPRPIPDLLAALLAGPPPPIAVLVNADAAPDTERIIARCRAFADALPAGDEALIVTLLPDAPPGLAALPSRLAAAALIEFTRQAALAWAPRRLRLNAIALGTPLRAASATAADIDRTIRAMAAWPSMTGQIIRLGA